MKSYKHYLLVTLALIVLGGTGCTNHIEEQVVESNRNKKNMALNDEKASTGISKDLDGIKENATAELDIYIHIVDQYVDAINNDFYKDILTGVSNEWDWIGADINRNLLSNLNVDKQYKVYYALEDVDKNGIPELFIGGSDGSSTPRYYDMFTFDKTRVGNPFSGLNYELGHRTNLYFYSDGIFEVFLSNGGFDNEMNFYKISSNGYSLVLVERVSTKQTSQGIQKYYHGEDGKTEISEVEFDSILQRFRAVGKAELHWIEIN